MSLPDAADVGYNGAVHSPASPILASARYRAVRKLGEGGMGAVFEVEDRELGGRCALKLMRASGDDGALLRFKREFRAVAQIHHPNLVRLYELSSDDQHWFYTMELVDGVDLQTALTRASAPPADLARPTEEVAFESLDAITTDAPATTPAPADPPPASGADPTAAERNATLPMTRCDISRLGRLLPQLLDALACLHRHGLVHRDLKPENILVDRCDRLRILDFGIVQELAGLRVTGAGNLLGTLAYMSPEQCNEGEVTAASDLYSLGCVLFQLLTGQPPFGRGSLKVALDHQLTEAPLVSSRVDGVPDAYVTLCRDLLAKDPLARPSIDDVRRRLELPADLARHEPTPLTFIGRERERAFLTTRLEAASQGQVGLVFLEGASGVGKSALARTMGERARTLGFSLFRGRCYERESVPFRAFDQVMDEVALHLRALSDERLRMLAPLIERVSWLFPALASFVSDEASRGRELATPPRDPAARPAAKLHLAMASLEVLIAELAEATPLMIVVDDLQWTDDESVAILEALLRTDARLLLFALHRPVAPDERHPLARFFARHATHPALSRLTLDPMSVAELATMVHHHAAGAISAQAAPTLVPRARALPPAPQALRRRP